MRDDRPMLVDPAPPRPLSTGPVDVGGRAGVPIRGHQSRVPVSRCDTHPVPPTIDAVPATDDPGRYGREWADSYDVDDHPDPATAVDFLADLAGHGTVLELAIGTGRIALPLAGRGPR